MSATTTTGAERKRRRVAHRAGLAAVVVLVATGLARAADGRPALRRCPAPDAAVPNDRRALDRHRSHLGRARTPMPVSPGGPPPLGAAGPPPIGAAGPPPLGAAGPPPVGAAGAFPLAFPGPVTTVERAPRPALDGDGAGSATDVPPDSETDAPGE